MSVITEDVIILMPDGTPFRVAVAATVPQQQQGMMGIDNIPPYTGMLFVYDKPGFHQMWMFGCLVPLDMLWLDYQGRIVETAFNVQPCTQSQCPLYGGAVQSCYAVEVAAGEAVKHGALLGASISF